MYQINLTFLIVRLVIAKFFVVVFFYVKKLVTGLTVREKTRYMTYWDDLSLTQLLVGRIGHPKKDRLAEEE